MTENENNTRDENEIIEELEETEKIDEDEPIEENTKTTDGEEIKKSEIRFEESGIAGADLILTGYGTSARVCQGAKKLAEKEGIKLGFFRPITLWPFPYEALGKIAENGKPILTVEMSLGQYVEDVRLAVMGKAPVHLLGHSGGVIPTEEEVFEEVKRIIRK